MADEAMTRSATTEARPLDLTDRSTGPSGEESLGELLAATTRDVSELLRKEIELAKVELKEEAGEAGRAAALLGAGGVVTHLALLLLLLAAAWGLAEAIPLWAALLVVGAITAVVAAILIVTGRSRLSAVRAVPITTQTLQEDVTWTKQQIS